MKKKAGIGIVSGLLLGCLLWAGVANARLAGEVATPHANVALLSDVTTVEAGRPFWVMLDFKLAEDWHIYWQNPGDSGLSARLDWKLPEGFNAEAVHWPVPRRIPIEGLMNYGYVERARLLVPVIPPKKLEEGKELEIALKASWLICHEVCVPESGEFSLTLNVGDSAIPSEEAENFDAALQELPVILKENGEFSLKGDKIMLRLPIPRDWRNLGLNEGYFYPETAGVVKHQPRQKWVWEDKTIDAALPRGTEEKLPSALGGVLELISDQGEMRFYQATFRQQDAAAMPMEQEASLMAEKLQETGVKKDIPPQAEKRSLKWWEAIAFALLGGVLLNAMPCVFPVLSLKALAISKKAQAESAEIRKQGIAYLAGSVTSFMILAITLIGLKHSGEAVGWGFQLQSPVFVAIMIYLFLLLGLALAGMYEMPQIFGNLGSKQAQKESASGSFFTGILAVLVATPCTVPFMAPALSYAFSQNTALTLLVMVAMGIGLALPYVMVSFYPSIQRLLPRPGIWMQRFKEFMAFPILATAAWLLWVLAQQVTLDGLAAVLSIVVILPFCLWLAKSKAGVFRWGVALVALALTIYSLALLEAGTPVISRNSQPKAVAYDARELEKLQAEGRPVFLNATAAWCITCKVNERLALSSEKVLAHFSSKGIVTMVADWTNHDKPITELLEKYDHQGVPLYVFFPPGGEPVVLPQLLTESIILDAVKGESQ